MLYYVDLYMRPT